MAEREPTLSGENACRQNDKLEITHATQYLAVIVSRKKLRSALESPCSPLLGWPADSASSPSLGQSEEPIYGGFKAAQQAESHQSFLMNELQKPIWRTSRLQTERKVSSTA